MNNESNSFYSIKRIYGLRSASPSSGFDFHYENKDAKQNVCVELIESLMLDIMK